ncbi:hypothetical protein [Pseudorhodobacter aquimaris]|uniref:hypothetical protein n=1 Tax=Pseudorhodobacter aquimaris TaxID=687412 RepID=UPI00067AC648|nr:hypothetical protein [Pseudorhodobacter aquimaris]
MADQSPIMPHAANKVSRISEFAAYFSAHLLPAIAEYNAAERDLEDVQGSYDPAYHAWERDADLARERLVSALVYLCEEKIVEPTDKPLKRMTQLIKDLVWSDDVTEFKELHRDLRLSFSSFFLVSGAGASAIATNALLMQARRAVDALVALPLYERWSDDALAIYHQQDCQELTAIGF